MVFGWFKPKKKLAVPLPPDELPSFPEPNDLDFDDLDKMGPFPGEETKKNRWDERMSIPAGNEFGSTRPIRREEEPLFLHVETYQSILDMIGYARGHLDRSGRMVTRLEELHDGQKGHLNHVNDELHEAHEKLLFIDSLLFKKG